MKKTFSVVSMFSGCGGMDLGFLGDFTALGRFYPALPFRIIWANDNDEAACRTYRHNLQSDVFHGDVWKHLDSLPSIVDVLIGGFPCQDISLNGKRRGLSGKRSGLYTAMVEAVDRVRPAVFVAENVKGLLLSYNQAALEKVITDFSDLAYDVSYHLYNAADYGVPQARERVFIVGTCGAASKFSPPRPTHTEDAWISARDAIKDLESVPERGRPNHIWSRAKKSPEQGNRKLEADRPAHTIRAECHGNIQWHYSLPRRISMREAARFQSFPDDFIFKAKLRQTERQVGNAVPPVLAWHVATGVAECLGYPVIDHDVRKPLAESSSPLPSAGPRRNSTSEGVQLSFASLSANLSHS